MRSPWCSPVDEVSKSFLEMFEVAQKPENAAQLVVGLAFDSAMKDADHDALSCHWKRTARLRMRVMGDCVSRCRCWLALVDLRAPRRTHHHRRR